MRHLTLLIVCVLALSLSGLSQNIHLVPQPQQISMASGTCNLTSGIEVRLDADDDVVLPTLRELIVTTTKSVEEFEPGNASPILFWAGTYETNEAIRDYCRQSNINITQIGSEGYILVVEPNQITLVANTNAGLLYGIQTFGQLVSTHNSDYTLPCLTIIDYPDFAHRAVMDDISRGPLSNMEFIKTQIRRLSSMKVNAFSFYIEHVVKTESHPGFAPPKSITTAELAELSDYASAWNIDLMGSFQSLGHFRNILSVPEYAHLGFSDRMLDPTNPEVHEFLVDVYADLIPVFSSEYFNINCDEAWDLRNLPDTKTPAQHFADHIIPLIEYVQSVGKTPMLWGDMLIHYPEVMDQIPEGTIVMTWDYGAHDNFNDWIDPFASRGIDYWVIPGVVNSNKLTPNYSTTRENLKGFTEEGYQRGASGVMNTVWDDGGRHFFARDWYGVAIGADVSWNATNPQQADFDSRFSNVFYGDASLSLPKTIDELLELSSLVLTYQMDNGLLELQLLPESGRVMRSEIEEWQAILSISARAQQQLDGIRTPAIPSEKYAWQSDIPFWSFTIEQLQLWGNTHLALYGFALEYRELEKNADNKKSSLASMHTDLTAIISEWEQQRDRFEHLWLIENKDHWLSEALEPYDTHIASLKALNNRITDAQSSGHFPSASEIGLDIVPIDGNYFTYWLLSDVYPIDGAIAPYPDYLEDLGGEKNVRPSPFQWQKFASTLSDYVALEGEYGELRNSVTYAYARITTEQAETASAVLTCDQGVEVILNGEVVYRNFDEEHSDTGITSFALPLVEGKNHLVLKFAHYTRPAEFSLMLNGKRVVHRKHRYITQN